MCGLKICHKIRKWCLFILFFFFNDTATTEIYTLSLHDALPICKCRENSSTRNIHNAPRAPVKTPHVPHTRTLEARIKEELVFQGLLEGDDQSNDDNDDEVLAELKRHQSELCALITNSRQQKQELYKLAQEEMKRQELRHRGQLADAEVMESFRKLLACKQKRKSPTKKEKEMAYKALKEREAIFRVLGNT